MDPGCKVQTGKHGFLVFLLKKDLLMVVGDEWWWKRAVVLIDFGQIEMLVAFWRWENWQQLYQEVCRAGLRPWALSVSGSLGSITLY